MRLDILAEKEKTIHHLLDGQLKIEADALYLHINEVTMFACFHMRYC